MLDTNAIAHLMRKDARVRKRLDEVGVGRVCVSVVSEAEARFGLARHENRARAFAVETFFQTVEILPWTSVTAAVYARLRAELERLGRPLAPLDMMIAAHALEAGAVLVSSDRALLATPGLTCENWLD